MIDKAEHMTADGKNFLIVHGDEYDLVTRYSKWISILGSWVYEVLMSLNTCLLYTSPSPRDVEESRMPSSA